MNYVVIEMQTSAGTTSTITYEYSDIHEAEQKYYLILSSAAVSSVEFHGAMLVDQYCSVIKSEAFVHPVPAPANE